MTSIKQINNIGILNKQFCRFSNNILKSRNVNVSYFVSQVKGYEKQYNKLGVLESFFFQGEKLAQQLSKIGLTDYAGILYAGLVKLPNIHHSDKERILLKAIKIAQQQGDKTHTLARTVDLKQIYKQYIKTLLSEESLLTDITNNYAENKKDYRTVSKNINSLQTYQFRLDAAKINIGKTHLKTEPEIANSKLKEAYKIFTELGREKEASFAQTLILQINQ